MRRKQNPDTLEAIVTEAIEREKRINKEHPERKGYGMVQGEANDLIQRIRALEYREELAQQVKGDRIKQRVKIVNNNQLYSRSPADIAISNIYREKINRAEKKIIDGLSDRSRAIYDMKESGASFTDIGKIINLHVSNVSRDYHKSIKQLKEEFKKVLGEERQYVLYSNSRKTLRDGK